MMTSVLAVTRVALLAAGAVGASQAATVTWTSWTSASSGTIALSPSVSVTYSGQGGLLNNYPSWGPASSFTGGVVDNAPPSASDAVWLTGGTANTNTLSFSSPVMNPVIAIWSLGSPRVPALFVFSEPAASIKIEAGGPSAEYAGTSIALSGSTVSGSEGNGVVSFAGTYSQISWVNPTYENYYAFTVGLAGSGPIVTPEPSTVFFAAAGLGLLALLRRRPKFTV